MTIAFTITPNNINLLLGGRMRTIDRTHVNFAPLKEALKRGASEDEVRELADIPTFIVKRTDGRIEVGDDAVRYNGQSIGGVYVTQLLAMLREGFDVAPLCRYLEKRELNPSFTAREEIDLFLQSGNFVLAPDGDILAFKKVNDEYNSYHDNRVSNKIGETVVMDRGEVDGNRTTTCSSGLHFCSYNYLPHYYGSQGRVVIVKINPADIVSIPEDYNNAKGRAWKYVVVGEVPEEEAKTFFENRPVYDFGEELSDYTSEDFVEEADYDAALAEVEASDQENSKTFHTADGRQFTDQEIIELVDEHGQRGASRLLGIARATIWGWLQKIKRT